MFNYRIPDAILLTVPYTGTHFARELFQLVGAYQMEWGSVYIPNAHSLDDNIREEWDKIIRRKLVITARDPYLSAIRCINTGHESPIEFIAQSWETCFELMQETEHFILDIGCQEERRLKHATNAIRFIDADYGSHNEHAVTAYVNEWLPANESHTKHKTEYLELGKLPSGHDWELLNGAVEWYKALTINE